MEEQILRIIAKVLKVDIEDVEFDVAIGDLPEWDSMHHLYIIAELEQEFGIKYNAVDLAELEDVSDLISLTREMVG